VLHRDIKPSNCFVDADGTVKVGDFGLAISTLARAEIQLTTTGRILGTPAFSSPEQLRGDELDVRSDIYSVGVTLWRGSVRFTDAAGQTLKGIMGWSRWCSRTSSARPNSSRNWETRRRWR
jgi:serine/threonine protein kinase